MAASTPEQVHARLARLAAAYEVDELSLVSITADFADRLRSYKLLAEAFELTAVLVGSLAGCALPTLFRIFQKSPRPKRGFFIPIKCY